MASSMYIKIPRHDTYVLITIDSARGAATNATARSWVRAFTPRNHNIGTHELIRCIGRTRQRQLISGFLSQARLGPQIQLHSLFFLPPKNRRRLRLRRPRPHPQVRKQMAGYSAHQEAREINNQSALRHTTYPPTMDLRRCAVTKGGKSVCYDYDRRSASKTCLLTSSC
jgi:hypothetical protein